MAKERVSVIEGDKDSNIMIVAPHGLDDVFTIEMTEALAELLDCHAVTNNGFKRAGSVDTIKSRANCNNTDHCLNDPVVYEEFTKPIINFVNGWEQKTRKMKAAHPSSWFNPTGIKTKHCFLFYIHGMDHNNNVDCVFGYGKGIKTDRLTMSPWRIACLYESLELTQNYRCAIGKAGGKYAARSRDNMTQLFRIDNWIADFAESVQIEFSAELRKSAGDAVNAAVNIAPVLKMAVDSEAYHPQSLHVKQI